MSSEEKIALFDRIQKDLWDRALHADPFNSILAAQLIRQWGIPGPNGEDPESA